MIVASFTPSYSLLAYLCQFLGTVINYLLFPAHLPRKKMLSLKVIRFSHRYNLQIINLEAVTFLNP